MLKRINEALDQLFQESEIPYGSNTDKVITSLYSIFESHKCKETEVSQIMGEIINEYQLNKLTNIINKYQQLTKIIKNEKQLQNIKLKIKIFKRLSFFESFDKIKVNINDLKLFLQLVDLYGFYDFNDGGVMD